MGLCALTIFLRVPLALLKEKEGLHGKSDVKLVGKLENQTSQGEVLYDFE